MVLHAKKSPVAQPAALVKVSLELESTLTTFAVQGDVRKDTLVVDRDHLLDRVLVTEPRFSIANEELRDLVQPVARL
jgi:hypothetical protein